MRSTLDLDVSYMSQASASYPDMKRHEKSVLILVLIVVVFLASHSFRLGLQSYQVHLVRSMVYKKHREIETSLFFSMRFLFRLKQQYVKFHSND